MSRTILCADDSKTIQKVVDYTFRSTDFQVVTTGSAAEALEWLESNRADVVFADVGMPEMDGYKLCDLIKSNAATARTPVLLLTGAFEPLDERRASAVAANGHIQKPFDTRTMIEQVSALCGLPSEPALPMSFQDRLAAAQGNGGTSSIPVPSQPPQAALQSVPPPPPPPELVEATPEQLASQPPPIPSEPAPLNPDSAALGRVQLKRVAAGSTPAPELGAIDASSRALDGVSAPSAASLQADMSTTDETYDSIPAGFVAASAEPGVIEDLEPIETAPVVQSSPPSDAEEAAPAYAAMPYDDAIDVEEPVALESIDEPYDGYSPPVSSAPPYDSAMADDDDGAPASASEPAYASEPASDSMAFESPVEEAPAYDDMAFEAPVEEAPAYDDMAFEAPVEAAPAYDSNPPPAYDSNPAPAYDSNPAPAYDSNPAPDDGMAFEASVDVAPAVDDLVDAPAFGAPRHEAADAGLANAAYAAGPVSIAPDEIAMVDADEVVEAATPGLEPPTRQDTAARLDAANVDVWSLAEPVETGPDSGEMPALESHEWQEWDGQSAPPARNDISGDLDVVSAEGGADSVAHAWESAAPAAWDAASDGSDRPEDSADVWSESSAQPSWEVPVEAAEDLAPSLEPPPLPRSASIEPDSIAYDPPARSAPPRDPSAVEHGVAVVADAIERVSESAAPALAHVAQASGLELSHAEMVSIARDIIERVAWEVVPDLAESIIRNELKRLMSDEGVVHPMSSSPPPPLS